MGERPLTHSTALPRLKAVPDILVSSNGQTTESATLKHGNIEHKQHARSTGLTISGTAHREPYI
jgi:hypothetical protein